ncbi:MAG: shikimate kinase [Ignavibacteriaceae bacterium]|nr:shikimate kinase [Ignavibacteriaceae bacterium]
MKCKRIFLTGFMGSGKSTLGQIIANTLGWNFLDLDKEIEKKVGKSITDIFRDEGESKFRSIESDVLKQTSKLEDSIIALGGGTFTTDENISIIKSLGKSIYIKSKPEDIYVRLRFKTNRPLFQGLDQRILSKEEALQKISFLMSAREPFYSKADIVFSVDNSNVGKVVDLLIKTIYKKFNI